MVARDLGDPLTFHLCRVARPLVLASYGCSQTVAGWYNVESLLIFVSGEVQLGGSSEIAAWRLEQPGMLPALMCCVARSSWVAPGPWNALIARIAERMFQILQTGECLTRTAQRAAGRSVLASCKLLALSEASVSTQHTSSQQHCSAA
jgi:hypothetical protein